MKSIANASQYEVWNGDGGRRWVARADQRDRVLAPVADALLTAASPPSGSRVLDVGCGCGATTLRAGALVGDTGTVLGVDLSAPMLAVGRERALAEGRDRVSFLQADAQIHAFASGSNDVVISRFGTMFVADPTTAFANLRRSLRPGGRLCLATWQPLAANEWLTVPGAALLQHTDLPPAAEAGPGMFAQSEPDAVVSTLAAAGLRDAAVQPVRVTFTLGATVDEAVEYLSDSGPGRALLDTIPAGAARTAALADVHAVLRDRASGSGVRLDGAIWLVTAAR
jgi:ubiquinone/menaquinone biosynthesis C-methylase UbiE